MRLQSNRQSGQASLEMILLLLVGVLIILGVIFRFNTAFKKYTIEMYGTYYRCLLETGELPGTGSICRDREKRFAISDGRVLVTDSGTSGGGGGTGGSGPGGNGGGSGPGGGTGGGGSGGSGGGSGGSGGTKGGGSGGGGGGSGGSGSGSGGGSGDGSSGDLAGSESVGANRSGGGRGSTIGRLNRETRKSATSIGSASDHLSEKEAEDASRDSSASNYDSVGSRSSSDGLRRGKTKMDFAMDGDQYQRAETAASVPMSASATTKKAADRDSNSLRPRRAEEKISREPANKGMKDSGGGLEFGKLFRFFLIAGIVIAIVVFLGGQVLQISKSGER